MKYYLATKQNETLPFAATWMDLEIILSEVKSEREKQVSYDLVKCKKKKKKKIQMKLFTKQKQTHREWMYGWLPAGERGGRNRLGVWEWYVQTAIFKINNQQRPKSHLVIKCSKHKSNIHANLSIPPTCHFQSAFFFETKPLPDQYAFLGNVWYKRQFKLNSTT